MALFPPPIRISLTPSLNATTNAFPKKGKREREKNCPSVPSYSIVSLLSFFTAFPSVSQHQGREEEKVGQEIPPPPNAALPSQVKRKFKLCPLLSYLSHLETFIYFSVLCKFKFPLDIFLCLLNKEECVGWFGMGTLWVPRNSQSLLSPLLLSPKPVLRPSFKFSPSAVAVALRLSPKKAPPPLSSTCQRLVSSLLFFLGRIYRYFRNFFCVKKLVVRTGASCVFVLHFFGVNMTCAPLKVGGMRK